MNISKQLAKQLATFPFVKGQKSYCWDRLEDSFVLNLNAYRIVIECPSFTSGPSIFFTSNWGKGLEGEGKNVDKLYSFLKELSENNYQARQKQLMYQLELELKEEYEKHFIPQ